MLYSKALEYCINEVKYCANETNIKVVWMSAQVHILFISLHCEYMYEYILKIFTDFL